MYKNKLQLCFFLVCFIFSFISSPELLAGVEKKDSLLNELQSIESMNEQEKAELFKNLASTYYFDYRKYDSTLYYAKKSLSLCRQEESTTDMAYLYKLLGYAYVDGEDYREGIVYLDSALNIYQDFENLLPVIQVFTNKGIAFNYIDKPERAIASFKKATDYSMKLGDSSQIAINTLNTGIMYKVMGEYPNATKYLTEAANMFEEIGDSSTAVNTFLEIGNVYQNWEKYDIALKFYNKADNLKDNAKSERILVSLYDGMGYVFQKKGRISMARDYYQKALEISKKIDYKSGQAQIYYRLGNLYKEKENYPQAIDQFEKSLALEKEIGSVTDIVSLKNELSTCYLEQGMYQKSLNELIEVREKCKEYNLRRELSTNYHLLYTVYKKLSNTDSALKYYEKHIALKDSIYGQKQEMRMENLREKYETEKKERTIEQLSNEAKLQSVKIARQNQQVVAMVVSFVLIVLVGFLLYLQWKRKEENRRLVIQQQLFRSQMNPHFIFNALNAIKNFILKDKGNEAADYLVDFSSLMRLILEGSSEDFTMLDEETKLLESYTNLQQLRFKKSFQYSLTVDDNMNPSEVVFPSMLLQPFVENAIEHGIKKGGTRVEVSIRQSENRIKVSITDNGPGYKNTGNFSKRNHKPKAIQITRERIKLFKKLYKWNILFSVNTPPDKNESGTIVVFEVPKKLIE
ncbi:MAG: tetratricopeptide repeat protein [Bacteroidales bacterium]